MSGPRFAFAAHPEALADLRQVPDHIRDLALLELQHLVHGNERGARLKGRLADCHKVYVDPQAEWRLVFQIRDAPASSVHHREIYLIAAGEREAGAVYQTATQRLHRTTEMPEAAPLSRQAQAARARSPHLRSVPNASTISPSSPAPAASPLPSVPRKASRA